MIEFIKNKLFGIAREKNQSVEVTPKPYKGQGMSKRCPSIDSKQKQLKDKQIRQFKTEVKKVPPPEEYSDKDEIVTIRNLGDIPTHKKTMISNINVNCVSDSESQDELQKYPYLLDEINSQTQQRNRPLQFNQQMKAENYAGSAIFFNQMNLFEEQATNIKPTAQSSIFPQRQKKMFVVRKPSLKKLKKIKQKCPVCLKPLQIKDSLQLACTHRYHRACAQKMKWNQRYRCELCDVKKNNRVSIVLMSNRRRSALQSYRERRNK